jgi:hypothetical protein
MPNQRKGEQKLNCQVCSRESGENEFCSRHLKAYENVVQQYEVWKNASELSWKAYLREIEKNSVTGDWAREIANYLSKKEETKDVGKN